MGEGRDGPGSTASTPSAGFRAAVDVAGDAEAVFARATAAHVAGSMDDAHLLAVEAAALASAASMPAVQSSAEHLLAIVHLHAGNYDEALDHGRRALEIHGSIGRSIGRGPERSTVRSDEGTLLNTLAAIHQELGDHDRAVDAYEAALAATEAFERPAFAALVHGNLGRIRAQQGRHDLAVAHGRRAADLARSSGTDLAANLLADLAEWYALRGDLAQCDACLAEARTACAAADGASPTSAHTRLGVDLAEARIALGRGEVDTAIAVLSSALDLAEQARVPSFELEIHEMLGAALKRSGRFEQALEHAERHLELVRASAHRSADLRIRTLQIARRRHGHAVDAIAAERSKDSALVQLDAFERLAILAEFRDVDTGHHTQRVGDLAAEIAHAAGESPAWCEQLRLAARLHDIGKVAVPDAVLLKSGPLTVEEFELMKTHTVVGHQILAGSSSPLFELAAELALTHHEWWDGRGYPHGHQGHEIPLSGRVVAMADVFDALCSERPYKRAWSIDEAARFVVSGSGAQFDPDLIGSFVTVLTARHPDLRGSLG